MSLNVVNDLLSVIEGDLLSHYVLDSLEDMVYFVNAKQSLLLFFLLNVKLLKMERLGDRSFVMELIAPSGSSGVEHEELRPVETLIRKDVIEELRDDLDGPLLDALFHFSRITDIFVLLTHHFNSLSLDVVKMVLKLGKDDSGRNRHLFHDSDQLLELDQFMEGATRQIDQNDRDDAFFVLLDVGFDRNSMLPVLNPWYVDDLDVLRYDSVRLLLNYFLHLLTFHLFFLYLKVCIALLDADFYLNQELLEVKLLF